MSLESNRAFPSRIVQLSWEQCLERLLMELCVGADTMTEKGPRMMLWQCVTYPLPGFIWKLADWTGTSQHLLSMATVLTCLP